MEAGHMRGLNSNAALDREVIELDKRARAPRIQLVPFGKINLGKERRYLVKGLIPRVGLAVVWGPPKSGKSFWTFDLTMHVALGWEYRGRRVHQGPVVYCAFEGASGIEARVEAFRQRFLAENADSVPFYLEPVTLDLVSDHKELIAAIRREQDPPAVVVLDTLNRSLRGSESSDQDMTAYIRAADAIREEFQCAVIVVHHCGISADRPRGHTSLTGAADAQLAVKRDGGGNILVTVEFMKDGEQGEHIASRLEQIEVGLDEDNEPVTSCVVIESEARAVKFTRKGSQLSKGAQIALKALEDAISTGGTIPPTSNHIPPNTCTVSLNTWREYAYARGISGSDEARARQQAFKRGAESLFASELVGTWQEQCWLV